MIEYTWGQWCGMFMNLAFAFAFLPQIIKSARTRDVSGVSSGVYWLSLLGYIAGVLYTICEVGWDWILLVNFFTGLILCTGVLVLYYRFHER